METAVNAGPDDSEFTCGSFAGPAASAQSTAGNYAPGASGPID
jgi:hypothetical protein